MSRSKQPRNWKPSFMGDSNSRRGEGTGWWMQEPDGTEKRRSTNQYSLNPVHSPLGSRYKGMAIRCECCRCHDGPYRRKNRQASQLVRTREKHQLRQELAEG